MFSVESAVSQESKRFPSAKPPRILIASHHTLWAWGIDHGLRHNYEIVAIIGHLDEVASTLAKLKVDLVLLDDSMAGLKLVSVIRDIRRAPCRPDILVLSAHGTADLACLCRSAGARSFVSKSITPERFLAAIEATLRGESVLPPISPATVRPSRPVKGSLNSIRGLPARQREVLGLIGKGYRIGEIASRLGISARTVETYRTQIRRRLEISTPAELYQAALACAALIDAARFRDSAP